MICSLPQSKSNTAVVLVLVVLPIIKQVELQERVKITEECGEIQANLVLVRVSGELELTGFYCVSAVHTI